MYYAYFLSHFAVELRKPECTGKKLRIITTGGIIEGLPLYKDDSIIHTERNSWIFDFQDTLLNTPKETSPLLWGDDNLFYLRDVTVFSGSLESRTDFLVLRYDAVIGAAII